MGKDNIFRSENSFTIDGRRMNSHRISIIGLSVFAYLVPLIGLIRNPYGGVALIAFLHNYEYFGLIAIAAFFLIRRRFSSIKERVQISIGIAGLCFVQLYTIDLMNVVFSSKAVTKSCVASELGSISIRDKFVVCEFETGESLQIDVSRSSFLKIHKGDTLSYTTRYGIFYPESFIEDPE